MNQRKANKENATLWEQQCIAMVGILCRQIEDAAKSKNPHLGLSELKFGLQDLAVRPYYDADKFESESLDELRAEIARRIK
jgi:hypothetical protein